MTDRQGIEIDYCPQCRGIWLDKGELDKLIEKAEQEMQPKPEAAPAYAHHSRRSDRYDDDDDDHYRESAGRGPRRRGGFLGSLMDFGD